MTATTQLLKDELDAWSAKWVDSGRLPCMSAAVSVGGQLVYEGRHGWADVEAKQPLEGGELFAIASLTKIVTAVAVMQLVERGLMSLEDPIEKYVPEFASLPGVVDSEGNQSPLQRSVLVVDLLRHTAGFAPLPFIAVLADGRPNEVGHEMHKILNESLDLLEMCRRMAKLPLVHQPGRHFEYGVSIDIAGCLVEVASGESIDEYFSKHIFEPLGMKSTCFAQKLTPEWSRRLVKRYRANLEAWRADPGSFLSESFEGERMRPSTPEEDYVTASTKIMRPGGGLVSSVDDLRKLGECLLRRGVGGSDGSVRVLSEASVQILSKDHTPPECTSRPPIHIVNGTPDDPSQKGFGLAVCVERGSPGGGFMEWGGIMTTMWWVDPKRDLVAVFCSHLWSSLVYPLRAEVLPIVRRLVPEVPAA